MKIKYIRLTLIAIATSFLLTVNLTAQKQTVTPIKKAPMGQSGTLSIEAGLIYKNGDVKPVARVLFRLLDTDFETLLKGVTLGGKTPIDNPMIYYGVLVGFNRSSGIGGEEIANVEAALKPHIIASVTTDFSGKATFINVKSGTYYLTGIGGTGEKSVVWNVPVKIATGKQALTLDNQNAAFVQ